MREETLPPTANFSRPAAGHGPGRQPLPRPDRRHSPGSARTDGIPRRAAVSAFGFGGINAHLLVEEWLPQSHEPLPRPGAVRIPSLPVSVPITRRRERCRRRSPWSAWMPVSAPGNRCRSFRSGSWAVTRRRCPAPRRNWWGAETERLVPGGRARPDPLHRLLPGRSRGRRRPFRIPPREMEEMLPQQLLMLQAAAGAMADAGLDREGNLRYRRLHRHRPRPEQHQLQLPLVARRNRPPRWAKELGLDLSPEELAAWTAELRDAAGPPLTANRTMGALGSVVASRIAREFRIGGPSFTLSSEESSGIRALETAVRQLQAGEIDRALVGAVDLAGDLRAVLGHHAARPFSPSGHAVPLTAGQTAALSAKVQRPSSSSGWKTPNGMATGSMPSSGESAPPAAQPVIPEMPPTAGPGTGLREAGIDPARSAYRSPRQRAPRRGPAGGRRPDGFFRTAAWHDRHAAPSRSVKADIGHCGAASGLASFVRGCLALYQEIIPAAARWKPLVPNWLAQGRFSLPAHPPLLAAQPGRRTAPGRGQRLRHRRHLQPRGPRRVGDSSRAGPRRNGSPRSAAAPNSCFPSPGKPRPILAGDSNCCVARLRGAQGEQSCRSCPGVARRRGGRTRQTAGHGPRCQEPGGTGARSSIRGSSGSHWRRRQRFPGSPLPPRPALLFPRPPRPGRERSPLSSPVRATTIPAWGWNCRAAGRRSSAARMPRISICAASFSRSCSGTALPCRDR